MIQVSVETLKTGMTLAKAVYNHQESLLLEAGAKITEKSMRMFKSWGVALVWVKGDSPDAEPRNTSSGAESVAAIESELAERFSDVIEHPVMAEIMRAASRVLSTSIAEQIEEQ
jgi:hypothetical protein